jgi:L-fucose isomerase-like protein
VAANELALKREVGPRVVPIDLPQLLARAQQMPTEEARARWKQFVGRAAACEVSESDGLDSMKVLAAVTEIVERHRLDALSIGCYPHLMGRVCLAASLLAEQGIPLACEGDVNGAVGQLLLTLLTGQPTHNTDWLDPLEDGSVVFTHCGSGSLALAHRPEDIRLASVRLMGQGVCALFPARPGPVTLVNLVPRGSGYQLALLEGEAVPTTMVFPGNPLRVCFQTPVARLIEWIHDEGIGHHWMAAYGRLGDPIRCWSHLAGSDLRMVCP